MSNIGRHLYPVVLLMGALGYSWMERTIPALFCFVLSFALWLVLYGDEYRK